ncbi:ABC transporter substrate-binding protein [Alicyclobacillus shizuokensis]|uniref:ABC transporter substrate-binding protein n=1 Tax=Alicyclobacillus shizuokensis TaxID=392014 RepID=UPI000836E44E|nr:ABC transporter substrate-binding protein [Alicyclobacillus shizuokensis]
MKKKIFLSAVSAVLAALSVSACGASSNQGTSSQAGNSENVSTAGSGSTPTWGHGKKSGFVIGFANGYFGNTWRSQFVQDVKNAAKPLEADGTIKSLQVANSNADVSQQINQLNTMINSGVDALMIDPVSATSLGPIIAKAKAKGILVVITNDPAAYSGTYAVVGNNDAFWRIQAEWIAKQLKGKGQIVEITGLSGNTADTIRQNAAKDVLSKYPNIKVLASVPGKWDEATAQSSMSTLLSTYKNIDGILEQDVMAEGVLRAYEDANATPPVMTGDYTFGFLRKWKSMPNLNSIAVSYAPGVGADALEFTIDLLKGKKLKSDSLQANPLNPNLKNTILIDPPYVVTKDANPNAPWMKNLKFTKSISLEEAVKLGQGKSDGAALDAFLTQKQVDSFFQ